MVRERQVKVTLAARETVLACTTTLEAAGVTPRKEGMLRKPAMTVVTVETALPITSSMVSLVDTPPEAAVRRTPLGPAGPEVQEEGVTVAPRRVSQAAMRQALAAEAVA